MGRTLDSSPYFCGIVALVSVYRHCCQERCMHAFISPNSRIQLSLLSKFRQVHALPTYESVRYDGSIHNMRATEAYILLKRRALLSRLLLARKPHTGELAPRERGMSFCTRAKGIANSRSMRRRSNESKYHRSAKRGVSVQRSETQRAAGAEHYII